MGVSAPTSEEVEKAFREDDQYFPTALQKFVFYTKYSRFNAGLGRRETWEETVSRSVDYLRELSENRLSNATYERIKKSILKMDVLPSMRLLAMAGPAARRSNITLYNCAYVPVDSIDSFVEALIISMSGTGVGFSVEKQYVDQLPKIKSFDKGSQIQTLVIEDSSDGWARALRTGLKLWFNGRDVKFDYSKIRPEGEPLKTKGGRASGPAPLQGMLDFARDMIQSSNGNLTPAQAHRLMCKVGDAAVSGGMRRTAMLSLFDFNDKEMLTIKSGDMTGQEYLFNANNSAVWPENISQADMLTMFSELVSTGRGEPGIFNREALMRSVPDRRNKDGIIYGTNPCGEIILRPREFCNLSAVVARSWDTAESLKEKVAIATIIGTIQSMATHFPGLRPEWKQNAEEERLLGVDITGQMDCSAVRNPDIMRDLHKVATSTNFHIAKKLKINASAAITCVKPSGNSSQLANCSSGLHPRWGEYYIRRVRMNRTDPVFYVLSESGMDLVPDNGEDANNARNWVASFPVKAPSGAILRRDLSAIEQLDYWLLNKVNWVEHNPSQTIIYKPHEIIDLLGWVWANRDRIGGLSFLPFDDAKYDLMPYEEINQEEYETAIEKFPYIDFSLITKYETSDMTTVASEIACSSGLCEV